MINVVDEEHAMARHDGQLRLSASGFGAGADPSRVIGRIFGERPIRVITRGRCFLSCFLYHIPIEQKMDVTTFTEKARDFPKKKCGWCFEWSIGLGPS